MNWLVPVSVPGKYWSVQVLANGATAGEAREEIVERFRELPLVTTAGRFEVGDAIPISTFVE